MATVSKGYLFSPTEQVTDAKLHTLVDGAGVLNIVNADIAVGAAIDEAKINLDGSTIVDLTSTQTISGDKTFTGTVTGITAGVANDGSVNPTNLLSNGDFESWSAGTSAAPDGWEIAGASAAVAREGTIIKLGTYSAKLTRPAGNNVDIKQGNVHLSKGIAYWKGRTLTYGCWAYATQANQARISLYDIANNFSSYHTGGSTWEWLTVTITVDATATLLTCGNRIEIAGDCYFDGAMCVEGSSAFAFSPKPLDASAQIIAEIDETKFSHKLPVVINGSTYYIMMTAT